jgi:hypothetical protein
MNHFEHTLFRYCKDKDILLNLLKQRPDFNIKPTYSWTIVMFAFIHCNDKDVLLEVLKQGIDLTIKYRDNKTALDYALETYVNRPQFEFDVLEKLYDENYKQDNLLINFEYFKLQNKYKIFPLILFRYHKRYKS